MVDFLSSDVPEDGAEWMRQMVRQLELTEKASLAQHAAFQQNTLLALVHHVIENAPAYRTRLKPLLRFDGSLDLSAWTDVPILDRQQAVALGDELVCADVPDDHFPVLETQTSGSTGAPFKFKFTQFHQTMVACAAARFLRWHCFDYGKNLASIRPYGIGVATFPQGDIQPSWAADSLFSGTPGKHFLLNINTPVDRQLKWLREAKPSYLISFASNLRAIALMAQQDGGEPLNLEGIMSYGEMLTNDMREEIFAGLGQQPKDCYSSRECGFLAGQSPISYSYLVQSELNLIEVLNDDNLPCGVGETGRVVITSLHNYAQPLLRYAIGDYAVVGKEDESKLPFPILSKIYGRSRNLFRFPGNKLIQPDFKTATFDKFLRPKQWQVAQIEPMALEIRFVPGVDPSKMDTQGMSAYICQLLGMDLKISYKEVSELTNPRTGKHEDYICELEL